MRLVGVVASSWTSLCHRSAQSPIIQDVADYLGPLLLVAAIRSDFIGFSV